MAELHQAIRSLRTNAAPQRREDPDSPWCLMEANVTSPVDNLPPFYEGMEGDLRGQGAAAARMRLFDELPSAGLGWDEEDMDELGDLEGLPGVSLPAGLADPPSARSSRASARHQAKDATPDSPFTKRLKRGFEQLELSSGSTAGTRSSTAVVSSVASSAAAAGTASAPGEPLPAGFLSSRRTLSSSPVHRVAIVGGTHGNEKNGVALAQHFIDSPHHIARPSFETVSLIGNPASVEANARYVEVDMNRCFEAHVLDDPEGFDSVEHRRARELNELLGPKRSADPRADFVIDLHNTTAQTGVALMLAPDDAFAHEVANHLMEADPAVVVVEWKRGKADYALLPTVGRSGMTFEVGACPWGCIVGDRYAQSRRLILSALDFIEAHNNALAAVPRPPNVSISIPVFTPVASCGYPEGFPMVHPSLQDRDFELLHEGDPVFMGLDGGPKLFDRADVAGLVSIKADRQLFPFFINEAAYYETGVAFSIAVQTMRDIAVTSKDILATEALPRL